MGRADFMASLPYPGTLSLYQNPLDTTDSHLDAGDWVREIRDIYYNATMYNALQTLVGQRFLIPYLVDMTEQNGELVYQAGGFREVELVSFDFYAYGMGDMELRYWGEATCEAVVELLAENGTVATDEDQPVTFPLSAIGDPSAEAVYAIVQHPAQGTVTLTGNIATYTPHANFAGSDSFTFKVTDGDRESNVATVSITVNAQNDVPIVDSLTLTLDEDSSIVFSLPATDHDGDVLFYSIVTGPVSGILSGNAPNLTYTPRLNFNGLDAFTFHVNDGFSDSSIVTVPITVIPVNDQPVFWSTPSGMSVEQSTYLYQMMAADVDDDALVFDLLNGPEGMTIQSDSGELSWMPSVEYVQSANELNTQCYVTEMALSSDNGTPELRRIDLPDLRLGRASLVLIDHDTYQLSVDVANRGLATAFLPSVVHFYSGEETPVDLLGTEMISFVGSNQHSNVQISVSRERLIGDLHIVLEADPALNECEIRNNRIKVALVHARVSDPGNLQDSQMFALNVEDSNTPPVVLNEENEISHAEGQALNLVIETTDEDIGDAHLFTLVSGPEGVLLDPRTGRLTSVAGELTPGTYSIVVEIRDLRGAFIQKAFALTVAANQSPVIQSVAPIVVNQRAAFQYDVDATDPDDDVLRYTLNRAPANSAIAADTGVLNSVAMTGSTQGLIAPNPNCQADPVEVEGDFNPVVKWKWVSNTNANTQIYGPASVGQLTDDNGDGVIDDLDNTDIVVSGSDQVYGRFLALIDGASGATHWVFDASVANLGSPSIADVDKDGIPEIYILRANQTRLYKISNTGVLLASYATGLPQVESTRSAVTISDLDGDGSAEFIVGSHVLNSDGTIRWQGAYDDGGNITYGAVPITADIDLDGKQEVIAGKTIYGFDGSVKAFSTHGRRFLRDGFNAVGNFDSDPNAEIVFSGGLIYDDPGAVALFDTNGQLLWGPIPIVGRGGPPTVGDFDGDGLPEIGVAGASYYYVFEHDGRLKWRSPIQDVSSSRTGSSLFDFEGDGRVEVVYADEYFLRVYDGATGEIKLELRNRSGTTLELPVIADVDNDGSAEIIFGSNQSNGGLRVIEDANDSWAPTRRIWNQHAYNINNINDDLTVPAHPVPSWLAHNSFRRNDFPDRPALGLADLVIHSIQYIALTNTVTAQVTNRGLAPVLQPSTVRFYHAADGVETLLGEVSIVSLRAGQTLSLNVAANSTVITDVLRVEVIADSAVRECVTQNNVATANIFEVQATDPLGLWDRQKFAVNVAEVIEPPRFTSSAVSEGVVGEEYVFDLTAVDPDRGDSLRFSVVSGPLTMKIRPFDGQLKLESPVQGVYTFTLRVEDSGGLFDEQTHVLTVSPPNNLAPVINSEAPRFIEAGALYSYQIEATDPEGQPLYYALSRSQPGMTIDESTGALEWQTSLAHVGINTAEIIVTDPLGKYKKEYFIIDVSDPVDHSVNLAPVITSIPTGAVYEGQIFNYQVVAHDPDGDDLTYTLAGADGDMAIDGLGQFTWLPTAAMVAQTFEVTILVSDDSGATASQRLTLPVNQAANAAPEIQSMPSTSADPDHVYRYEPIFADSDGDHVHLMLEEGPNGLTVNGNMVEWTPSMEQAGQQYQVALRFVDARGAISTQIWSIAVIAPQPPNTAPRVLSLPIARATVGNVYSYDLNVSDLENDVLEYVVHGPEDMIINTSGELRWLPGEEDLGLHSVRVSVSDGRATTSQTFTLEVVTVGVNHYPEISSIPSFHTIAAQPYTYQIVATDEDGDALTYGILSGPTGASVSIAGTLSWTPILTDAGIQDFVVFVDDGHGRTLQSYSVNVLAEALPLSVDVVITPQAANPGDTITFSVFASGGSGSITRTLELDGVAVALDVYGQARIVASGLGRHTVEAGVTDASGSQLYSTTYTVLDASDSTPPLVSIEAPTAGSTHLTMADIIATVHDTHLFSYKVMVSPRGQNVWQLLAEGHENVASASVATFDPTLLINGQYDIGILAEDLNGLTSSDVASVQVEGDLKVGNFTLTLEDLSIPMVGIPIQVTRTYDSRRRFEDLDFGCGWSIDYQNVRVDESRDPGAGWALNEYRRGPLGLIVDMCIEPLGAPVVTVTLPDGDIERFEVGATPQCNTYSAIRDVTLRFTPVGDTQSTLTALNDNTAYYLNGQLVETGLFVRPVNPGRYLLTTQAGYKYYLNQQTGIEKVVDPNGHTLTYSNNGIFHSSGKAITFVRDSRGRINKITDPNNREILYTYNAAGDLVTHRDQVLAESTYTYNSNHGLLELFDPLGRKLIKNLYDEEGRLYAQEDGQGNTKSFNHDLDANSSVITDRDGRTKIYTYDERGHVEQDITVITDGSYASDIVNSYSHDAQGNELTRTLGAAPYTWVNGFDTRNNQLFARDPEGHQVDYLSYNARGQETQIQDEMGRITTMAYDTVGHLVQIDMPPLVDPDTGATQIHRASNVVGLNGQVQSTTDLRGLTTTYTYYAAGHAWAGQKQSESNPVSGTVTYTYDGNNNVKTETRERTVGSVVTTETTTYDYDGKNRLTKTTFPDSTYTETVYDLAGNVDQERDRFGHWTDYRYDEYGRLAETVYPDDSSETRTYSREGLLETVTDRMNHTTSYEYDDAGRLWKTTFEDGTYTETRFTPQGWVQYEWDEKRNLTEYEYDLAGKRRAVIRHIDGIEQRHDYSYYANGELSSETDALGRTTTYYLNAYDQRIETRFHNGTDTQQRYDAMGARTRSIDQEDTGTDYGYDALGRLHSVQPDVEIDGSRVPATRYTYDQQGNKLSQTDANDHITRWTYDYHGRVLSRTLPEGMSENFVYDDAARTQTHTDFNGQSTVTQYDTLGRIEEIVYHDGTSTAYTYWNNDQIHTVMDQHGTTTYIYDNRDRLESETQPDGTVLAYDYDAAGNRTEVKVSRDNSVVSTTTYTHDDLNRLETVTDAQGTSVYTYDAVGNLDTVTYPNGMVEDYDYNSVNQLTTLSLRDSSGTLINRYSYTLTDTGRRDDITELSGRHTDYRYDSLYRLTDEVVTDAANGNYSASYAYDWVGNRTFSTVDGVSTAYLYDDNDRLTQQGGTVYSHDDNGNTLTETLDGNTITYRYDARNRMTGLSNPGTSTTASYAYNHNGIRIGKTENSVTTTYLVDENRDYAQVLMELDASDNAIVQYTYGHDLIRQDRAGNTRFYHYDGLGSTRALSDSSESITDSYNYEAFGEVLNQTGSTDNSYLFTGEQFDASLDQYYLRARYYDQGVGRFTQMDTWQGNNQDPVTLHKYLYANGDPVMYIDPTGYYSQNFGYEVEKEIESQYLASHVCGFCQFGSRQYFSYSKYLKPDIMNWDQKLFNEIKPLSISGIAKGKAQLALYKAVYGSPRYGFSADTSWNPKPTVVDGTFTYFENIDGIIFYTDDDALNAELKVATLATVSIILKNNARKVATRLGADAVLRAALSNGIRAIMAANTARLSATVGVVTLGFF